MHDAATGKPAGRLIDRMATSDLNIETDAARGRAAAELLLDEGIRAARQIHDPLSAEFAAAFVETVASELTDPRGWVQDVLDGGDRLARNLRIEPDHGFIELIQNGDDLGATTVRFVELPERGEILVVHNGGRVVAPNVLAMTLALVSTKTFDPNATGKFGIGLKTLNRIATGYEVHCPPYRFGVRDQKLHVAPPRVGLSDFYEPEVPETMLVLATREGYQPGRLQAWFEEFGADGLIFMTTVRRLELHSFDGAPVLVRELQRGEPSAVQLRIGQDAVEAEELELVDEATATTWRRLSLSIPPPPGVGRSDKASPARAPFAVASPSGPVDGRLFAGLPLRVGGAMPFHANALFDTDTARADLLESAWNDWVLAELSDVAAAAAVRRLRTDASSGWQAVPLRSDVEGIQNDWLARKLRELTDVVLARVKTDGEIVAGEEQTTTSLGNVVPETVSLEALLEDDDVTQLTGAPTVPRSARDQHGRWRRVLTELGIGEWLQVEAALPMFDWDGLDRPGHWFVSLVAAGLAGTASGKRALSKHRCLKLANGDRLAPDNARDAGFLLGSLTAEPPPLGSHLRLLRPIDPAYLADTDAAKRVREWLEIGTGVRTDPTDTSTLEALAGRDKDDPIHLDDTALLLLRLAMQELSDDRKSQLGRAIGWRVTVDGQEYNRGRALAVHVRPAEAYLPGAIDTGQETWPKAADKTPGLRWIHPRYAKVLSSSQGRLRGTHDDPRERARRRSEAARRRTGAQAFLALLGAATSPRVVRRTERKSLFSETAAPVVVTRLPRMQRDAWPGTFSDPALQRDWLSPDLQAVVQHIAASKVPEMRTRGAALLRCLDRAWNRVYAAHTESRAVSAYWRMSPKGVVPATWIAQASEVAWMTDERGHKKAPIELAVRTARFEAVVGDIPGYYAYGLGPRDVELAPVRTFGFRHQLLASDVLDTLEDLRDEELAGKGVPVDRINRCYLALAESAPSAEARGQRLDDIPVSEVRKRFRSRKGAATGLLWTNHGWKAPAEVLRGRPIFRDRASFVEASADRLWDLLGVSRPGPADCRRVLKQVAEEGGEPSAESTGVLIDTYRFLAQISLDETKLRALSDIPVWTGTDWRARRPVYAVDDPALQRDLGRRVPVWQPPVRLGELGPLLEPLGITLLRESDFAALGINRGAFSAGSEARGTLQAAAGHFREWLAAQDGELHDKLASLPALEAARVAVNSKLHVEIALPTGVVEQVPRLAHVHVDKGGLTFVLARRNLVSDRVVMGRLIAHLLDSGGTQALVLELGWQTALDAVRDRLVLTGVQLATDAEDPTELEPEPGLASARPAPRRTGAGRFGKRRDGSSKPSTVGPRPPRRLKNLDDIDPDVGWLGNSPSKAHEPKAKSGVLREPRPGRPPAGKPGLGPVEWTDEERETLGLRLLSRHLRDHYGRVLSDTRDQPSVGADAVDQDGRYYEMKVSAGDLPDRVRLEPSEFDRARQQRDNFILAVIGGIEEGFTPAIRLIPNPLDNLHWEPTVDIVLTGIAHARPIPEPPSDRSVPSADSVRDTEVGPRPYTAEAISRPSLTCTEP